MKGGTDAGFRRDDGSPTIEPVPTPASAERELERTALVGVTLGDKYRLERLLGHGGMGAVYEALGPNDRCVAVKVVLGDKRKPESLRRFVREARTTTAIDSPYVVRVLDVDGDSSRGVPYIAMELLRGTDLERTIRARGPLEPEFVARLFMQACNGLAAVHARGVVHRDIKPANIFLHEEEDGRLTTKICDFGIAKQLQQELDSDTALQSTDLTNTGSMIGSPPYMSPEQARSSKDIDPRTDVWSLGASMYEALSGKRVWEGRGSLGEILAAIIGEPVPNLLDVAPWVHPGLAAVVGRALDKDRAKRFASVTALADALEPFALQPESFVVGSAKAVSPKKRSASRAIVPPAAVQTSSTTAETRPRRSRAVVLGIVGMAVAATVVIIALRPAPVVTAEPAHAAPEPTHETPRPASSPMPSVAVVPAPAPTLAVATASASATAASTTTHKITTPRASASVSASASASKKKPDEDPNVPNIF